MNEETWVSVVGYEGLYEVSNFGKIRSIDRIIMYRNGINRFSKGKLLKLTKDRKGYLRVTLCSNKRETKLFQVHRLVAIAFILNELNLSTVNHKNGIKDDNSVSNLEWCSVKGNIDHAVKNNLMPYGERIYTSKLKNVEVSEIKQRYWSGESPTLLAKEFNVHFTTIYKVINKINYSKVDPEIEFINKRSDPSFRVYRSNKKPIKRIHPITGEVKIFESMLDAAKEMGIGRTCIFQGVNGKIKISKGYKWEYLDKTEYLNQLNKAK